MLHQGFNCYGGLWSGSCTDNQLHVSVFTPLNSIEQGLSWQIGSFQPNGSWNRFSRLICVFRLSRTDRKVLLSLLKPSNFIVTRIWDQSIHFILFYFRFGLTWNKDASTHWNGADKKTQWGRYIKYWYTEMEHFPFLYTILGCPYPGEATPNLWFPKCIFTTNSSLEHRILENAS